MIISFIEVHSQTILSHKIDSLQNYKIHLQSVMDSIKVAINAIDLEIKRVQMQQLASSDGYPAIISTGFCIKGSDYFKEGEEVLVTGYLGVNWIIVHDGKKYYLGDRCIKFKDVELDPSVLRDKFVIQNRRIQDSITLLDKRHQDSMLAIKYLPLDIKGKTNYPFRINDVIVTNINSADGVDFAIRAQYLKKDKTIKYLYFTLVPYNAVYDRVRCRIRGYSEFTGKVTGPINSSYDDNIWYWEASWYNNTIECLKLTKVLVEYTDGSSYTYINEVSKILGEYKNTCTY